MSKDKKRVLIDELLAMQEEGFDHQGIKGMVMQLIIAGIHTSALTMEWALSLLLNHPEVLEAARSEIETVVGSARLIEDSDLPKLPYLNNIIRETLRLYPPGPMFIPHASSADCTVGGYYVPRDTILFVNAYAIHRDPTSWDEPTKFRPERFDVIKDLSKIYFPFGIGRRSCPGDVMAMRMISLAMGAMIQCFEWARIGDEAVDLREACAGTSRPKAQPLVLLYKPREVMVDLLSTFLELI